MGSSGDYLSPNMGKSTQAIGWKADMLEADRSMMDPGIAGMLQWLDAPVSNFPWYSADLTFYKQAGSRHHVLALSESIIQPQVRL